MFIQFVFRQWKIWWMNNFHKSQITIERERVVQWSPSPTSSSSGCFVACLCLYVFIFNFSLFCWLSLGYIFLFLLKLLHWKDLFNSIKYDDILYSLFLFVAFSFFSYLFAFVTHSVMYSESIQTLFLVWLILLMIFSKHSMTPNNTHQRHEAKNKNI